MATSVCALTSQVCTQLVSLHFILTEFADREPHQVILVATFLELEYKYLALRQPTPVAGIPNTDYLTSQSSNKTTRSVAC